MVRAQSALISLTRLHNVSADPPCVPSTPAPKECSSPHCTSMSTLKQLRPVRKASCTRLSTLCPESHIWSLTLITACRAKLKMFFLFFSSFEAPLQLCHLGIGLAKRTYMRVFSQQRAARVFRNSESGHNVLFSWYRSVQITTVFYLIQSCITLFLDDIRIRP